MPGFIIKREEGGGFETIPLKEVRGLRVCVAFQEGEFADAWFEDAASGEKFHVLGIDCPAPVNVGLYRGQAWYRWVWAWETMEEADEAEARNPEMLTDSFLDDLVAQIDDFVSHASDTASLDVTGVLQQIACGMCILPYDDRTIAQSFEQYQKRQRR